MNLLSLRPVAVRPDSDAAQHTRDSMTATREPKISGHAIDVADDSHRFVSTQAVKCVRPLPNPSAGGKGLILPFLFGGHRQLPSRAACLEARATLVGSACRRIMPSSSIAQADFG